MRKHILLASVALFLFSLDGEAGSRRRANSSLQYVDEYGVTHTYRDSNGNQISKAQYDADVADYNRKAALPSSWIDSKGTVHYYTSELNGAGTTRSYTRNNYGPTYSTTNNYGATNYTQNNYSSSNGTINNYGNSNLTINNYGNGRTTVNDYGSSRTSVYRRR